LRLVVGRVDIRAAWDGRLAQERATVPMIMFYRGRASATAGVCAVVPTGIRTAVPTGIRTAVQPGSRAAGQPGIPGAVRSAGRFGAQPAECGGRTFPA
jgi:hypothetical protein